MLVWRLNLAWKSGYPNQCLRLGDDAKTNRTLRARFRESAIYSSPLSARAKTMPSLCTLPYTSFETPAVEATMNNPRARAELSHSSHPCYRLFYLSHDASTDCYSVAPHASTSAFPKLESVTGLNARDASLFRLLPTNAFACCKVVAKSLSTGTAFWRLLASPLSFARRR